ncbi:MAG: hypothetical protein JWR50_1910 [Mucilaginibacter sp.]|nr:hypothetical protein [Mucilaginibacter sp.]
MDIEVKDPATGALLRLDARPEQVKGIHGFRIRHPNGSGFFITSTSGTWRSGDDHHIDTDFLVNIGLALERQNLSGQIGYTDNQPNVNSGMGEEGLIDPNGP